MIFAGVWNFNCNFNTTTVASNLQPNPLPLKLSQKLNVTKSVILSHGYFSQSLCPVAHLASLFTYVQDSRGMTFAHEFSLNFFPRFYLIVVADSQNFVTTNWSVYYLVLAIYAPEFNFLLPKTAHQVVRHTSSHIIVIITCNQSENLINFNACLSA